MTPEEEVIIVDLFNNAQTELLESLNNKTIDEVQYAGKTLVEWDTYFTVRIERDASMTNMRDSMVDASNLLDECRNLLSGIDGKFKNVKIKMDSMKKQLQNSRLEYNARGAASNLKMVERQLTEEYLALEMSINFTEIILNRFQENLKKLIDKKKVIEVILYNMQNELRHV